jgi:T-complex protein 1 subunit delta
VQHFWYSPTQIASVSLLPVEPVNFLQDIEVNPSLHDRGSLLQAETCFVFKVVAQNSDLLAPIAVDSVVGLNETKPISIFVTFAWSNRLEAPWTTELVEGLVLTSSAICGSPSSMKERQIALIPVLLGAQDRI